MEMTFNHNENEVHASIGVQKEVIENVEARFNTIMSEFDNRTDLRKSQIIEELSTKFDKNELALILAGVLVQSIQ